MNDMIKEIDVKTANICTTVDAVKQLGGRIVEGMDHDRLSDTSTLLWRLIKQSFINMISTAYTYFNNLRIAVRKTRALANTKYVEFIF